MDEYLKGVVQGLVLGALIIGIISSGLFIIYIDRLHASETQATLNRLNPNNYWIHAYQGKYYVINNYYQILYNSDSFSTTMQWASNHTSGGITK